MKGMIEIFRERALPIIATVFLGVVAGAGLVPLLPLGNDSPPEAEPAQDPQPTTVAPPTSMIVEVESSQPTVPGLDPSISRALVESGFVVRMERAELEEEIDPDIVRVLEGSNAVVTVLQSKGTP